MAQTCKVCTQRLCRPTVKIAAIPQRCTSSISRLRVTSSCIGVKHHRSTSRIGLKNIVLGHHQRFFSRVFCCQCAKAACVDHSTARQQPEAEAPAACSLVRAVNPRLYRQDPVYCSFFLGFLVTMPSSSSTGFLAVLSSSSVSETEDQSSPCAKGSPWVPSWLCAWRPCPAA